MPSLSSTRHVTSRGGRLQWLLLLLASGCGTGPRWTLHGEPNGPLWSSDWALMPAPPAPDYTLPFSVEAEPSELSYWALGALRSRYTMPFTVRDDAVVDFPDYRMDYAVGVPRVGCYGVSLQPHMGEYSPGFMGEPFPPPKAHVACEVFPPRDIAHPQHRSEPFTLAAIVRAAPWQSSLGEHACQISSQWKDCLLTQRLKGLCWDEESTVRFVIKDNAFQSLDIALPDDAPKELRTCVEDAVRGEMAAVTDWTGETGVGFRLRMRLSRYYVQVLSRVREPNPVTGLRD